MTYELAKKLKETGFKQIYENHKEWCKGAIYIGKNNTPAYQNQDLCYCPTLSELIEACRIIDYEIELRGLKRAGFIASSMGFNCEGNTPEEAVAYLWLKLNKK